MPDVDNRDILFPLFAQNDRSRVANKIVSGELKFCRDFHGPLRGSPLGRSSLPRRYFSRCTDRPPRYALPLDFETLVPD